MEISFWIYTHFFRSTTRV